MATALVGSVTSLRPQVTLPSVTARTIRGTHGWQSLSGTAPTRWCLLRFYLFEETLSRNALISFLTLWTRVQGSKRGLSPVIKTPQELPFIIQGGMHSDKPRRERQKALGEVCHIPLCVFLLLRARTAERAHNHGTRHATQPLHSKYAQAST